MAKPQIEPRLLKGFRDTLPDVGLARQEMIRKIESNFLMFGFVPIDTPALEYADILLGKGSAETDKQLYRFRDNGDRDVALRFDLTVPLARFAAMYVNELGTPFKRYHIASVWRAEKPQRGRYREFIQCDFDIIGAESPLADAEILTVVSSTLSRLEIGHKIRLNNRKVLNGLLELIGARDRSVSVLRAIDKLEKLGEETVKKELAEEGGLSPEQIGRVFTYLELSRSSLSSADLLKELSKLLAESELGKRGISDISTVLSALADSGVSPDAFGLDLSIARGLDYYTGTVFETSLLEMPGIGSICSGGRYDDLASLYTSRKLPGVGGSIGLDRILGAYEELGKFEKRLSSAKVLVTLIDQRCLGTSLKVAHALRAASIPTEVYPEIGQLGAQLKYGDKKGIPLAIIIGENELASNTVAVKDLRTKEQHSGIALDAVATFIQNI